MEAFTTTFSYKPQPFQLPFSFRRFRPPLSQPISLNSHPSKPKPSFKINSSRSFPPIAAVNNTPNNPLSFLKTPLTIAVASTAIFFCGLGIHKPLSVIAEQPQPTVENLTQEDDDVVSIEAKEKSLEELVTANPNDVEALKSLMEVKIKLKKLPEAVEVMNRLIELEPEEVEWPLLRSHMYSYMGEAEMAKAGFEEIIAKDPARVEAFHGLVMAVSQGEIEGKELEQVTKRVEEAMERSRKGNKVEEVRDFKLLIAQIRVIQGNYTEALKVYQELVKEEPRDFRPYLCQGIIYTLLRKKDEAQKQFDKYKRLVPKGHPYARFFDDNMLATKVFSQMAENERTKVASKN